MLRELSVFGGSAVLLLAIGWTTPGFARVECKGDFQVTKHGLLATPIVRKRILPLWLRVTGWQRVPRCVKIPSRRSTSAKCSGATSGSKALVRVTGQTPTRG